MLSDFKMNISYETYAETIFSYTIQLAILDRKLKSQIHENQGLLARL